MIIFHYITEMSEMRAELQVTTFNNDFIHEGVNIIIATDRLTSAIIMFCMILKNIPYIFKWNSHGLVIV